MSALRTLSALPQLRLLAALALIGAGLLVVALAAVAPAAAAVLALIVAAATALLGAGARPTRRPARPAPLPEAAPTLRLSLPDGASLSARPVALPGAGEHQLLLTRDGYVVVDAAGNLVHKL